MLGVIGLSKYWGIHPIKAFYLSATLTYSRMQLPRSYDHLSLPSTSALSLLPRLLSHYPRFNALEPPIVRLIASSGNRESGREETRSFALPGRSGVAKVEGLSYCHWTSLTSQKKFGHPDPICAVRGP